MCAEKLVFRHKCRYDKCHTCSYLDLALTKHRINSSTRYCIKWLSLCNGDLKRDMLRIDEICLEGLSGENQQQSLVTILNAQISCLIYDASLVPCESVEVKISPFYFGLMVSRRCYVQDKPPKNVSLANETHVCIYLIHNTKK